MLKIKRQYENQCPVCGSENLDYEAASIEDIGVKYPYTCLDCGFKGDEWHNIVFSVHLTRDGESIESRSV